MPEKVLRLGGAWGGPRQSRFYKINSHLLPAHDLSVYVDCRTKSSNVCAWLLRKLDLAALPDWTAIKHHSRSCIYEEAHKLRGIAAKLAPERECYWRDEMDKLDPQMARYQGEGFPTGFGLFDNTIILRRNTPRVRQINEMWWEEYQNGVPRDQIALPVCFWRLDWYPEVVAMKRLRKGENKRGV